MTRIPVIHEIAAGFAACGSWRGRTSRLWPVSAWRSINS